MITKKDIFIVVLSAIAIGIAVSSLFIKIFPQVDLKPTHIIAKTLGLRKPVVLGFVPYWLIKKTTPETMSYLNNITYFGLTIDVDGTLVRQSNAQENEPGWQTLKTDVFSDLVKDIPDYKADRHLLVHLSNEASISALLSEPTIHAQNLVNDSETIMETYNFNGLNIDIESFTTATPETQQAMTTFLREVKNQLVQKKLGPLVVELTVSSLTNDHILEPAAVGEIADTVVLMAYDFHYNGSTVSGPVAPLGGAKIKWGYDVIESVKLATQVIPSEKILLGIPLYGYEWETLSYDPESPVIPGTGKTATAVRVQELVENCANCKIERDEMTGSPYLILPPNEDSAIQQIYFEDSISIQRKLNLAQEYNLGGVALWAIGYENEPLLQSLTTYKKDYQWK